MTLLRDVITALLIGSAGDAAWAAATEFCLDGRFDLGLRGQGTSLRAGEFVLTRWCVITEDQGPRTRFEVEGRSNPDMDSSFTVTFLPPDRVRIVTGPGAPDLDFVGADAKTEAARHRRIDPRRMLEEIERLHADRTIAVDDAASGIRLPGEQRPVRIIREGGRLRSLSTTTVLPLEGEVPVEWSWQWDDPSAPQVRVELDGQLLFEGTGRWRTVDVESAARLWTATGDAPPTTIDGSEWPSVIDMDLEQLDDGVFRVTGVRTGFHHIVIRTSSGLVIGDAPAGWVEIHQIPPTDLAGDVGVSGLSERLIDFLAEAFPGEPIRAVVLTHFHDDHAGGARAFAAAGADLFAPAGIAEVLESRLSRPDLPPDRLGASQRSLEILPVDGDRRLPDPEQPVTILDFGPGPHVDRSLGVLAEKAAILFVSDIHVPGGSAAEPSPGRARTECWFARVALDRLPDHARVINSHSLRISTVDDLRRLAASATCNALQAADEGPVTASELSERSTDTSGPSRS